MGEISQTRLYGQTVALKALDIINRLLIVALYCLALKQVISVALGEPPGSGSLVILIVFLFAVSCLVNQFLIRGSLKESLDTFIQDLRPSKYSGLIYFKDWLQDQLVRGLSSEISKSELPTFIALFCGVTTILAIHIFPSYFLASQLTTLLLSGLVCVGTLYAIFRVVEAANINLIYQAKQIVLLNQLEDRLFLNCPAANAILNAEGLESDIEWRNQAETVAYTQLGQRAYLQTEIPLTFMISAKDYQTVTVTVCLSFNLVTGNFKRLPS